MVFVAIVLVFSLAFFWWSVNSQAVSSSKEKINFVITKGMSASQIGSKLKTQNIIKSPLAFKVYLQVTGSSGKIQAGEYLLSGNKTLIGVVKELLKGPTQIWVTIPEGLRREEVAMRTAQALTKEGEEYRLFISEFLNLTQEKEGYLFPDTYLVPKDTTAAKVVSLMENTFDKKVASLGISSDGSISTSRVIIIASLVERETKTDAERALVAGVINNRLKIGMGLQIDATLQYALATSQLRQLGEYTKEGLEEIKFWRQLTSEDKKVDSIYNTYKYNGLPPTPICNPGASSIKAALNPEESDYLYYLHDTKGQIHFASSLEEHNQNIRKYLDN